MSAPSEEEAAAGLAERTLDDTRRRLADLDGLPVSEHVAVFDRLHQDLTAVLGSLDQQEEQGGP
ncbi:hypothetical protein HNR23_001167 [Nocardiopsis mwathae]|uniref:MarR family transcriptional regulator n=1 Tax=Nocardiopsis mwathae TaxID=1472723 RepID=A0A7X0D4B4_9ACTN|nr:hypothetical protein [Nocardiopsis mwathae]MBB6171107.1 hypothetical protein [Nocardiopsis mwathae]